MRACVCVCVCVSVCACVRVRVLGPLTGFTEAFLLRVKHGVTLTGSFYFRPLSNRAGVSRCLDVGPDGHSDVYGAPPKVHRLRHGQ